MTRYMRLGCPECSILKPTTAHTYAAYYVYKNDSMIKLICKGCKGVQRFRYIEGGVTGLEEDINEND